MSSLENCIIFHPFHLEQNTASRIQDEEEKGWEDRCLVSIPAKRHLTNFLEHFEEVVKSSGSTISSISTANHLHSLLELTSFEMGRIAISFDEEDFDDFYEDFYELVPAHTWPALLISHLIHLVIKHVPLDYLLPQLAEICIGHSNYTHAFEIMKAFWMIVKPTRKSEYSRALAIMKRMNKKGNWMRFLAHFLVTYDSEKEFLFEAIDVEGSGLKVAAIILSTEEYRHYDYRKTGIVVEYLVKHCCKRKHMNISSEQCCCFTLLTKETELLLESDVSTLNPQIMFALYFSGLFSNECFDSQRMFKKLSILLPQCTDLIECISPFTTNQIAEAAAKAEVTNAGDLACALLAYNINQLRQSMRNSGDTNDDLIKQYESDITRIQSTQKPQRTWRYEVIADEWIANTPQQPKKVVLIEEGTNSRLHNGTPLHAVQKVSAFRSDAPSSTTGKTPSRRIVDILRSGTEGDPLTAVLSVERIRLALNEKQRRKQAMRLAATPHLVRNHSRLSGIGGASPMIQESPAAALRPPLGRSNSLLVNSIKDVGVMTLEPCVKRARIDQMMDHEESSDPLAHQDTAVPPLQFQVMHAKVESDIVQSEDDLIM